MHNAPRPLRLALLSTLVAAVLGYAVGRARADGAPTAGALVYSGRLTDAAGAPMGGSRSISVQLWGASAAGDKLCESEARVIELVDGRFEAPLPDSCSAAVAAHADAWVDVQVDGVSLGRSKLSAVPYAIAASTAAQASGALKTTLEGLAAKAELEPLARKTDVPTVTTWQPFAPDVNAGAAAVPGQISKGSFRRVGDTLEVRFSTTFGAAVALPGPITFGLPPGYKLDTAALPSDTAALGTALVVISTYAYSCHAIATPAGRVAVRCAATYQNMGDSIPAYVASGSTVDATLTVPVTGSP